MVLGLQDEIEMNKQAVDVLAEAPAGGGVAVGTEGTTFATGQASSSSTNRTVFSPVRGVRLARQTTKSTGNVTEMWVAEMEYTIYDKEADNTYSLRNDRLRRSFCVSKHGWDNAHKLAAEARLAMEKDPEAYAKREYLKKGFHYYGQR